MLRPVKLAGTAALAAMMALPALAQDDAKPLPATSTVESAIGTLELNVVARGLVHPWALAFLPDGRMLVTERNDGRLRIVDRSGKVSDPVEGVPRVFRFEGQSNRSQGGLFDVKVHPAFQENRLVYLSMSRPTERGASVTILRGRLEEDGSRARIGDVATVFDMQEKDQDSSGLHFGGRMALDAEQGALFLSIGERRNISRAQDGEDQAGSILRVSLDGAVPSDNPFRDDAGVNDHIFAKGNRNSQALAIQPGTRALWSADHGPLGGDRVFRVEPGANLGWPYINPGRDYSGAPLGVGTENEGMKAPAHVFEETVAPSGAVFYDGEMFGAWKGQMLVGGLANKSLNRIEIEGERVTSAHKVEIGRRIRDVKVGPDGALWLLTEHADGEVVRVTLKQ